MTEQSRAVVEERGASAAAAETGVGARLCRAGTVIVPSPPVRLVMLLGPQAWPSTWSLHSSGKVSKGPVVP